MPFVRCPRASRKPTGLLASRLLRDGGAASLSAGWREWLAENVALGVADEDLLAALAANGVPPPIARREIDFVRSSPITRGARRLALRLRRRELLVRLHRELALTGSAPRAVERRDHVSAEEFFDRYYATQSPVVLTDALEPWPRLREWSPRYFRERFGDAEVEVMEGRDADPASDSHFKDFSVTTRLGDFCDRVTRAGPTNDFYLVANNRVTGRPALRELLDDVAAPHPYLEDLRTAPWASMWFGPAGTFTPWHHDTANVLFCQVYGRKRFLLVSPFELGVADHMRNGVYAALEPEAVDAETPAATDRVLVREVVLSPGDALFVPVGYWHEVRALDVSISIGFSAFRKPNQFDWYRPGQIGHR
ncbi:MAG: cupin-like domain-containing protein [Polyangiaceae bacterium]|nr:cupin-like domain-containing protein [Polyangiaceae bacterium]